MRERELKPSLTGERERELKPSLTGERERELKPNFTDYLHTLILAHTINIVGEVLPNRTKLVNVLLE